jgi:hypothetical protein
MDHDVPSLEEAALLAAWWGTAFEALTRQDA